MRISDLRYSEDHEWVSFNEDGTALIGISEFAAESLGDIVFVDLPEVGSKLTQFDKMGEIESVKAVSDLYSPLSGIVKEINQTLIAKPELVNESPFDAGWMLRIQPEGLEEVDNLMTPEGYESHLASRG